MYRSVLLPSLAIVWARLPRDSENNLGEIQRVGVDVSTVFILVESRYNHPISIKIVLEPETDLNSRFAVRKRPYCLDACQHLIAPATPVCMYLLRNRLDASRTLGCSTVTTSRRWKLEASSLLVAAKFRRKCHVMLAGNTQ